MFKNPPEYVIAIGTTAESLNEVNIFFDQTTLKDVAYIIIQHLSADFKFRLKELLTRHGQLQVREVKDDMRIQ